MNASRDFYPRRTITLVKAPRFAVRQFQPRRLLVIRPEDVTWLIGQLRGRGWRTATELGATSGGQKRKLKAIVESAHGAILHFRGSPGFKLISEATRSQIERGIAVLRAEARLPLRRALNYRRQLNERTAPVTGQLFPQQ